MTAAPHVLVASKSDLAPAWPLTTIGDAASVVDVSAATGAGLDGLRAKIVETLTGREELRDAPAISNTRHLALLDRALTALQRASSALANGATEELVLADLTSARETLEEITGRRAPEDLLRHIFARFCIGK